MRLFPEPWGNYLVIGIHETSIPESISWLPTTIGWQVIYAIICIFLLRKIHLTYKSYKRNAYRREATACLEQLNNQPIAANKEIYQQLPALLRTVALRGYARDEIAGLTGERWEEWLDQRCDNTSFSNECKGLLHQLSFAPLSSIDTKSIDSLLNNISIWVKNHRRLDD